VLSITGVGVNLLALFAVVWKGGRLAKGLEAGLANTAADLVALEHRYTDSEREHREQDFRFLQKQHEQALILERVATQVGEIERRLDERGARDGRTSRSRDH
jgi:hypothetical protein